MIDRYYETLNLCITYNILKRKCQLPYDENLMDYAYVKRYKNINKNVHSLGCIFNQQYGYETYSGYYYNEIWNLWY